MSTLVATPDDLATFLGQTVDPDRALQLLGIAQGYCEDIVTPLPASAFGIVLAAAARAYGNPFQITSESVGPFAAGRTPSVYLLRSERTILRRAAGRGGGGSTSTLPKGANAVQTVTVAATAGTWTLIYNGAATSALSFNPTAADIQAALSALPNIGPGNVSVTGSGVFTVTFINNLGQWPVATLVADGTDLTGAVTVAVVTEGVTAPGTNLPEWDYDYSTLP